MTTNAPTAPRWWQWPTVLSLDAPSVVIVWQWLFASVAGVAIHASEVFVVGASVWLAYAADRWIEGWRLSADTIQTPRHRFYHDHRWPVAAVWIAVLGTDITVAFVELTNRELLAGVLLLTPTLLYLLSHQLVHRMSPWRVPKELCVAALIAGGASVFVLADAHLALLPLAAPILLFAALCFTNVALIAAWEEDVDETHGQESLARRFRHAAPLSRVLPLLIIAAGAIGAVFFPRESRLVAGCVTASGALLLLVDRLEPRFGRQPARVLADLVLLTPLVPLLLRSLTR